jgi:hypothetical protein
MNLVFDIANEIGLDSTSKILIAIGSLIPIWKTWHHHSGKKHL